MKPKEFLQRVKESVSTERHRAAQMRRARKRLTALATVQVDGPQTRVKRNDRELRVALSTHSQLRTA
jgi:hypothetical protein